MIGGYLKGHMEWVERENESLKKEIWKLRDRIKKLEEENAKLRGEDDCEEYLKNP